MKPHWLIVPLLLLALSAMGQADPFDTWTWLNPPPTQRALYSVVYGNGQFVAVGDGGIVLSSADGVNWDQHLAKQTDGLSRLKDVVYGNGQFVAAGVLGFNEGGSIQTSTDGANWIDRQSAGGVVFGIAYGNGLLVAVGDAIQTSADGTNWFQRMSVATNELYGITYGNGQFVAVGGSILTSADGINWVQRSSRTQEYLLGIAYGNGQFVAVGERYHGIPGAWIYESSILTSADGVTWVQRDVGTSDAILRRVAYGNGQFVAVGDTTTIQTSADGVKWVQHESDPGWLSGITYGNGHFLAVGNNGTILESGVIIISAIKHNGGAGPLILSLAGSNGPGRGSYTIQTSTDLISWRNLTNIIGIPPIIVTLETPSAASDHVFYRAFTQ